MVGIFHLSNAKLRGWNQNEGERGRGGENWCWCTTFWRRLLVSRSLDSLFGSLFKPFFLLLSGPLVAAQFFSSSIFNSLGIFFKQSQELAFLPTARIALTCHDSRDRRRFIQATISLERAMFRRPS